MTVELTCQECGKDYETSKYKAERSDNNFCSQSCYGNWIGGTEECRCEYCGSEFRRYSSAVSNRNFCDKDCHDKWQRENRGGESDANFKGGKIEVECAVCGSAVRDYPSRINRSDQNYCSRECSVIGNRNDEYRVLIDDVRDSYKWEIVREEVLERDRKRCQECGADTELHVHHITPLSEGGEPFDKSNLVTLCKTCHYHVHH